MKIVFKCVSVIAGVVIMASVFGSGCATKSEKQVGHGGADMEKGKFLNTELRYENSFSKIMDISWEYMRAKRAEPQPQVELPVNQITADQLKQAESPVLYRLGHSSVLIKLDGEFFLTDPVFSERSSPVQWAGPKRFHDTPLVIEDLPPLKAVVISHDHYDHLDKDTVKKLSDKAEWFVTPLKVGQRLIDWGLDPKKVIEKDWWQSVQLGSVKLVATPAQHFSGRGMFDKDETLWASWVIQGEQANLFFSGDSGYFSGFKEIGERYGPFDITMIETGAYNEMWSEIHMLPEQSVQAHLDLKGRAMLPIHNSTFDLALHDWYEPLERVSAAAELNQVRLLTPIMGEQVSITKPAQSIAWWLELVDQPGEESLVAN